MAKQPNMNEMLKQVQQMQAEMMKAQEDLKNEIVEASAGGGMVTVKMTGEMELREIVIDPEAVDPEEVLGAAEPPVRRRSCPRRVGQPCPGDAEAARGPGRGARLGGRGDLDHRRGRRAPALRGDLAGAGRGRRRLPRDEPEANVHPGRGAAGPGVGGRRARLDRRRPGG